MAAVGLAVSIITAPSGARAGTPPVKNQVKLELQITGLKRGDYELEIKPGHPGCQFPSIVRKVKSSGARSGPEVIQMDPILAQSTSADRDCAFAIVVREPGQPPRTFYRGMRLASPTADRPLPVQSLTCYISTPTIADRDETPPRRR
jgi:hypothetical protein